MLWTIYSYGNGDVIASIFEGLKLVFGSGAYESLLQLALLLLVLGLLLTTVFRGRFLWPVLMGGIAILLIAVTLTVDVAVEEQVDPLIPDVVVTDVPLIVAFPAYVTGTVGFELSVLMETVFPVPDTYVMSTSPFNRSWFDFQKTLEVYLPDGDLRRNTQSYLVYCVFRAIAFDQLQRGDLLQATDLLSAIAVANAALTAPQYVNGNPIGALQCPEFYSTIIQPGYTLAHADYQEAMRRLRVGFQADPDLPDAELDHVDPLITALLIGGQDSRSLINTMLIREVWREAERQDRQRFGDVAGTLVMTQQALLQDLKYQAYTRSYIAQKLVPLMRTVGEGIVYLLAPFLLVLAFQPGMGRWLGLYLRAFAWVALWGPIFVVMNFLMFTEGSRRLTPLTGTIDGIAMVNFDSVREFTTLLNTVASDLTLAVPLLAWGLVWGGSHLIGGLMGGLFHAAGQGDTVATQFARGRGSVRQEGLGSVTQQATVGDEEFGVITGPAGLRVDQQTGASDILDHEGGVARAGANGTLMYRGPRGEFVENQEGRLIQGFRVHSNTGSDGVRRDVREEVLAGSQLRTTTVEENPDGTLRTLESVSDIASRRMLHELETTKSDRTVTSVERYQDGSSVERGVYQGSVEVNQGGETDIRYGALTSVQAFDSHGEPVGPRVSQFEGNDGYQTYRLYGVGLEDSQTESLLPGLRVTSGDISNKTRRELQESYSSLSESLSPRGDGFRTFEHRGLFPLEWDHGFRALEEGILTVEGTVRDGHFEPTAARFRSTEDPAGALSAEGQVVFPSGEPAPLGPDGMPLFTEEHAFFRVSRADREGLETQRTEGPHGLPTELRRNADGSYSYTAQGDQTLQIALGDGLTTSETVRLRESGRATKSPSGFEFSPSIAEATFTGPPLAGERPGIFSVQGSIEDGVFHPAAGQVRSLVDFLGVEGGEGAPLRSVQEQVAPESILSGPPAFSRSQRGHVDEYFNVDRFEGAATFDEMVKGGPSILKDLPVYARAQYHGDQIIAGDFQGGIEGEFVHGDTLTSLHFQDGGEPVFRETKSGTRSTTFNRESHEGVMILPGQEPGQYFRVAGTFDFDPTSHEMVSARASSVSQLTVENDGGLQTVFRNMQGDTLFSETKRGDLESGIVFLPDEHGKLQPMAGVTYSHGGDLVSGEGNAIISTQFANDQQEFEKIFRTSEGEQLYEQILSGVEHQKKNVYAEQNVRDISYDSGYALLRLLGEDRDPSELTENELTALEALAMAKFSKDQLIDFKRFLGSLPGR
ncbi:MAG: hypothetical protein NPIRA02_00800 [Nitrospirales bacterium]|nr:MAG: hypothetical protein NPIRA02_00800 [Nitrospirales bacterium]